MTTDEFVNKITKKEEFTPEEIESILEFGFKDEDCSQFFVTTEEGTEHRWDRDMRDIITINDQFYAIPWRRGLTEYQENSYYEQPYKVDKIIEVKTITRYVPDI